MPRIELTEVERLALAKAGADSIPCNNGWRSIETAPKDGTDILVIDDNSVTIGWWSGEEWCRQHLYLSLWGPTLWQPLPRPYRG
jgi:hypothetical protein